MQLNFNFLKKGSFLETDQNTSTAQIQIKLLMVAIENNFDFSGTITLIIRENIYALYNLHQIGEQRNVSKEI